MKLRVMVLALLAIFIVGGGIGIIPPTQKAKAAGNAKCMRQCMFDCKAEPGDFSCWQICAYACGYLD